MRAERPLDNDARLAKMGLLWRIVGAAHLCGMPQQALKILAIVGTSLLLNRFWHSNILCRPEAAYANFQLDGVFSGSGFESILDQEICAASCANPRPKSRGTGTPFAWCLGSVVSLLKVRRKS
jgi:hypothetical protein